MTTAPWAKIKDAIRGRILRSEFEDAIGRLGHLEPTVGGRAMLGMATGFQALAMKYGPFSNISILGKRKIASELRKEAKKAFIFNMGEGHGLALLSMLIEAETLNSNDAKHVFIEINKMLSAALEVGKHSAEEPIERAEVIAEPKKPKPLTQPYILLTQKQQKKQAPEGGENTPLTLPKRNLFAFVKSSWHGDTPLWHVVLVYGFGLGTILALLVPMIFYGTVRLFGSVKALIVPITLLLSLFAWLLAISFFIWITVSIWRCAAHSKFKGLARLLLVMWIIGAIGRIAASSSDYYHKYVAHAEQQKR